MRIVNHTLSGSTPGSSRVITSLHFGTAGSGKKAYLQASLHADELPGMLVLHHLRTLLLEAESHGRMKGEVVLVPVANPIGLAQTVLRGRIGRFDLDSGQNFNRSYPDFFSDLKSALEGQLGSDAEHNVTLIRECVKSSAADLPERTELDAQRKQLIQLSCDADIVLDLHCDAEAVVHVYTESPCWPRAEAFCRLIGAQTILLAKGSGALSFDEAHSEYWWHLAEAYPDAVIPQACFSATVELRGQADLDHFTARLDAESIFKFLILEGVVDGPDIDLPDLEVAPTPLAGSETLFAPVSGLMVFRRALGDMLEIGDAVVDIIEPVHGTLTTVHAGVAGRLYARENRRFATAGMELCKIAGSVPFRSGMLLGV
ncbi:succinylglutamate desuccinylase/aspartoacylase family protein [Burkholderiaceae bacterium DAT-1]|nr:succinylglutamate desuccinylase/aspartoacylase family protein [Burkholderiaceae bacterium DAT-1]